MCTLGRRYPPCPPRQANNDDTLRFSGLYLVFVCGFGDAVTKQKAEINIQEVYVYKLSPLDYGPLDFSPLDYSPPDYRPLDYRPLDGTHLLQ